MSDDEKKCKLLDASGFLNLSNYLPYHFSVAAERMSVQSAQLIESQTGLTMIEWRVLAVINSFKPLSVRNVASFTSMNKVAVSRAVSNLCSLALVVKEVDETDNRLVSLTLTEQGEAVLKTISKLMSQWFEFVFADFNTQELASMQRLSDRLGIGLNKYEEHTKNKGAA